ncbi:MAG TPA: hypothetical protein VLE02_01470 [Nitrosarchaeum sp.]|nr:hypothetical protein [Nitrosarchaeum sp.]
MANPNVRIDCVTQSKYPPCEPCTGGGSAVDAVLPGDNVIVDASGDEVTISANVFEVEQPGNTFTIGTALYFDGALWQRAISTSFATSGTHIVTEAGDPTFRVTSNGMVDFGAAHGFPLGSLLYVSPTTVGTLTTTNPTAPYFSNPIARVIDAERIEVFSYLSEIGLPPSTIFLNPVGGNDANDGLTVGNAVLTLTSAISKFGTNTSGPSNRTANIIIATGTLNLGASPTINITPLANIGFSQLIIIGNTTVTRSGLVTSVGALTPSQQFNVLGTDQVGMGVNAFRNVVLVNNTDGTDSVIESNTATTLRIPDGNSGNMTGFALNNSFSMITHNTTLTWASGSVIIISTRSIQLKLRHMIILAGGAADQTMFFRQPSGSADNGAVLATVTGCSLNTAAHNAMFTGYEMNFVGCLISGGGSVNGNFVDHICRYVRVFITDATIVPVNGTSGGVYATTQTRSIILQNNSNIFGCKIESSGIVPVAILQIINASVRGQGIHILSSTGASPFGILLSASVVAITGIEVNGNALVNVGMGVTRGSTCRTGFTPGGIPNDFSNNVTHGIAISGGSKLDTGISNVLTSTVANGAAGFGVSLSSASIFTFALTPTITGGLGNCGLGASGTRTWALVAGGLAANVNDFANASPQNVIAISAP